MIKREHGQWRALIPALLMAAWLGACAQAPTPPTPEATPASAPAEPALRLDPQLGIATRLAEATLTRIARQHVTPIPTEVLYARFTERLAAQLSAGPWREPRPSLREASLAEVIDTLHRSHPDRPILPAVEAALSRLLRALDDGSLYFDRRQFGLLQRPSEERAGIGVLTGHRDQQVVIREVLGGSPADRAGLGPGDELIAIDGEPVAGQSRDQVMTRLLGRPGSGLALRIRFAEGDTREIDLRREFVDLPLVEGRWLPGAIAHVRLRALSDTTVAQFNETFLGLIRKQRAPRALILDLRDNHGGVLEAAVQLADLFVAEGTLLSLRGRVESEQTRYMAQPRSKILEQDLPLVVLINGETTAGAESIAAALQDHRRALLIGQRSRGAGRLYSVFKLPDQRGLKLAIGHLYRPAGGAIAPNGVVPDICVSNGEAFISDRAGNPECPREAGPITVGKKDPVLNRAARIVADKPLYRDLLEGRLEALPTP
ncbi:MAG: S41 family peptidase [Thiohalophilus sp.]|uniref:S41 family peptidase n=1 Tax=Thiohalophilus sp. TaxID=3028392 RepID=UPI00286FD75F|nr:S41 family peptidase [Thiohalophilus sp.]MDR9436373.1 S41 family peptidase [Thiohalophilus sp.]